MTQAEFKAWFDGFTENIEKAPSLKQWARIKERVGEIDGKTVTERVYIDRYWPSYDYHSWRPYYTGAIAGLSLASGGITSGTTTLQASAQNGQFSSTNAMYALGTADAAGVA